MKDLYAEQDKWAVPQASSALMSSQGRALNRNGPSAIPSGSRDEASETAAMMNRDHLDKVAWLSIRSRAPIPISKAGSVRALNYASLDRQLRDDVNFEYAGSNFLHAFYAHRAASFFAYQSPSYLGPRYQALLAGVAEWFSAEFELPYPEWTNSPKYFLDTPWDPKEDLGLDMSEFLMDRMARSPAAQLHLSRP